MHPAEFPVSSFQDTQHPKYQRPLPRSLDFYYSVNITFKRGYSSSNPLEFAMAYSLAK
jgi:hypothetical protein